MSELSDSKRAVDAALVPLMQSMGFARVTALVYRRRRRADELVLFGVRRDVRGFFALTASLAIRFPEILSLLDDQEIHLNVPLHLLKPGRHFEERKFSKIEQVESTVADLGKDLKSYGLDFFDAFGDSTSLRKSLKEGLLDLHTKSDQEREVLHAALEAGSGDRDNALKLIQKALASLEDAPFKRRYLLEVLRDKISALGPN